MLNPLYRWSQIEYARENDEQAVHYFLLDIC